MRELDQPATTPGLLRSGAGLADPRIGAHTRLRDVNSMLSSTHVLATATTRCSALASDAVLARAHAALERYRRSRP
jgi:hypothetical protein